MFAVLEREGRRLFPDAMFDDLFSSRGRRSVPPRVVATVMVLQRWFGLSDREAVAAFEFDLRWRFACGGLDVDGGGFCHTVLVGMRARLAASSQPRRIFDAVLAAARSAGALSVRRVLDSVPIYDAVATQDTATMLQRAIRAVLAAASDAALGVDAALRGGYASGARAHCDWDDPGPDRNWWTVSARTRPRCSPRSRAANSTARSARPPSCWPRWPARTCARTAAGAS